MTEIERYKDLAEKYKKQLEDFDVALLSVVSGISFTFIYAWIFFICYHAFKEKIELQQGYGFLSFFGSIAFGVLTGTVIYIICNKVKLYNCATSDYEIKPSFWLKTRKLLFSVVFVISLVINVCFMMGAFN